MPGDRQHVGESASVQITPAPVDPNAPAPAATPAPDATTTPAQETPPVTAKNPLQKLASLFGALMSLVLLASIACTPATAPAGHQDDAALGDEAATIVRASAGPDAPRVSTLLKGGLHKPQTWHTYFTLEKRLGDDPSVAPYEVLRGEGNLLTLAGAKALWQGFSGGTVAGGNYTGSTGNAAIAVGDAGAGTSTLPNPLPAANVGDVDVDAGFTAIGTGISSSTCSAGTVTVTTSAAHGLSTTGLDNGQLVNIYNPTVTGTGYAAGTAGYQGTFAIASVPSTTTFTYSLGNGGTCPTSNLGAGGSVRMGQAPLAATAVSCSAGTTTVTVASGAPAAGQTVVSTGNVPTGYNGTYVVATSNGSTSFTYAQTCPAANTTLGHFTGANRLRVQPTTAITYAPSGTPNGIQYAATYSTSQANWTWGSWGLDNSVAGQAGANLFNHAIVGPAGGQGLGTKTSAASWTLTITLSLS